MPSVLPGNPSLNTTVGLTKVALRLLNLAEFANAIGDLTGLGQASIESLVRTAEKQLAVQPSAEFNAVATADREWVEGVLARSYIRLTKDPARQVMRESLIGAEAVVRLADGAMTTDDRRDVRAASDDVRAYLYALSGSIGYLISQWYSTNAESNRAAMSQAVGETLQTVRALPDQMEAVKAHFDSSLAPFFVLLEQLGDLGSPEPEPEPEPEPIVFELDFGFAPLATDAELAELVKAAALGVLEDKPLRIEVSLPTLDRDVNELAFGDVLHAARLKREYQKKAQRLRLALSAFFSIQVEKAWSHHLRGVPDRVTVVRAILAEQEGTRAKLDVWRTAPPLASAPIWLTPDEVEKVVKSVRLSHWDHLAGGAGWRAADELPRSVIVEKVMSSILAELVRRKVTSEEDWIADVLFLSSWHIGQG